MKTLLVMNIVWYLRIALLSKLFIGTFISFAGASDYISLEVQEPPEPVLDLQDNNPGVLGPQGNNPRALNLQDPQRPSQLMDCLVISLIIAVGGLLTMCVAAAIGVLYMETRAIEYNKH